MAIDRGYGFKFLDPTGATYPNRRDESKEMFYALPRPGEKWGPWMEHPRPASPDGRACGPGRYHVMLKLDARYAPMNWWLWFVEFDAVVGHDDEKAGVLRLRLRRISPTALARALRPPFNWGRDANLQNANLQNADLRNANLQNANLQNADLRNANLRNANLWNADLWNADLRYANLRDANLRNANLRNANLRYADLRNANLRNADLWNADLRDANLTKDQLATAIT